MWRIGKAALFLLFLCAPAKAQDNSPLTIQYLQSAVNDLRSGVPTYTSSPTFRGTLEIAGTGNGLVFPDGTKQTTAATSSSVFGSTGSVTQSISDTNTSFKECESTATVTAAGNPVLTGMTAGVLNSVGTNNVLASIIRTDGTTSTFLGGADGTDANTSETVSGNSHHANLSFTWLDVSAPSGTLGYCVGFQADAATWSITAISGNGVWAIAF